MLLEIVEFIFDLDIEGNRNKAFIHLICLSYEIIHGNKVLLLPGVVLMYICIYVKTNSSVKCYKDIE